MMGDAGLGTGTGTSASHGAASASALPSALDAEVESSAASISAGVEQALRRQLSLLVEQYGEPGEPKSAEAFANCVRAAVSGVLDATLHNALRAIAKSAMAHGDSGHGHHHRQHRRPEGGASHPSADSAPRVHHERGKMSVFQRTGLATAELEEALEDGEDESALGNRNSMARELQAHAAKQTPWAMLRRKSMKHTEHSPGANKAVSAFLDAGRKRRNLSIMPALSHGSGSVMPQPLASVVPGDSSRDAAGGGAALPQASRGILRSSDRAGSEHGSERGAGEKHGRKVRKPPRCRTRVTGRG